MAQRFEVPRSLAVHREEIRDRATILRKCQRKLSCSLRLCCRLSGRRDQSRPDCCEVETFQTRPDHPAARAHGWSFGCEPDNQRERGSGRITLDKHALLVGQRGCLILDKGARRTQAVRVKSCQEDKHSSWNYVVLCPYRREPSRSRNGGTGPSGLQVERTGRRISWTNRLKRARLSLS